MSLPQCTALALPVWVATKINAEAICPRDEAKLELALQLARRNVEVGSAQPCCQCYGATLWAKLDQLSFAASATDVEALTAFDEGPLPADWEAQPAPRGIVVRQGLLRDEARTILATDGHRGSCY